MNLLNRQLGNVYENRSASILLLWHVVLFQFCQSGMFSPNTCRQKFYQKQDPKGSPPPLEGNKCMNSSRYVHRQTLLYSIRVVRASTVVQSPLVSSMLTVLLLLWGSLKHIRTQTFIHYIPWQHGMAPGALRGIKCRQDGRKRCTTSARCRDVFGGAPLPRSHLHRRIHTTELRWREVFYRSVLTNRWNSGYH